MLSDLRREVAPLNPLRYEPQPGKIDRLGLGRLPLHKMWSFIWALVVLVVVVQIAIAMLEPYAGLIKVVGLIAGIVFLFLFVSKRVKAVKSRR
ncbi:hypothetical protein MPC38_06850 [Prescottella equi]|uniref:hypothetical protein n=1 Tax=Rhodococcus hoagii TaxID=43767 RepID=UPI001F5BBB48|nr:hypothetical protein [Prescottella equi]UNQ40964.1 hypothetical protein MPC38_06850 [Prescottella equi]